MPDNLTAILFETDSVCFDQVCIEPTNPNDQPTRLFGVWARDGEGRDFFAPTHEVEFTPLGGPKIYRVAQLFWFSDKPKQVPILPETNAN